MKILSISPYTKNIPVLKNEQRTHQNVGFYGSKQNLQEKILQNPDLLQKYLQFMSDGLSRSFLNLLKNAENVSKELTPSAIFNEIIESVIQFSNSKKTNENDSKMNTKPILLKKRGGLTKEQKTFKRNAENLNLTGEYKEKLQQIWLELIKDGKNTRMLTAQIAAELSIQENYLLNIIDNYYNLLVSPSQQVENLPDSPPQQVEDLTVSPSQQVENLSDSPPQQVEDLTVLPFRQAEKLSDSPPQQVEDLTVLPPPKAENLQDSLPQQAEDLTVLSSQQAEKMPDSPSSQAEDLPILPTQQTEASQDFPSVKQTEQQNMEETSPDSLNMPFQFPGTINDDLRNAFHLLKRVFKKVLSQNNDKPVFWIIKKQFDLITEDDILAELKKEKKKDKKTDKKSDEKSSYNYINEANAAQIRDIINSDSRFSELFCVHSALRLIDRFVDFNSKEPIEKQCKEILDALIETVKESFKRGIDVKCKSMKKFLAPKFTIPPEYYGEDAKKFFGTVPLTILLCENVVEKDKPSAKKYIFCTLYPEAN